MPSPYVADSAIGPRILNKLRQRFPAFTERRVAVELGCSAGHAHSLFAGTVELGFGAILGLARACGDLEALIGAELASLNYALVRLPAEGSEEYEVEIDATAELPGKYRSALTIHRALQAVSAGNGADLSATDLEALSEHRLALSELLHLLEERDAPKLRSAP